MKNVTYLTGRLSFQSLLFQPLVLIDSIVFCLGFGSILFWFLLFLWLGFPLRFWRLESWLFPTFVTHVFHHLFEIEV